MNRQSPFTKRNQKIQYVVLNPVVARTSPTPSSNIVDAFKEGVVITTVKEQDGWLQTDRGKWILKSDDIETFRDWMKDNPGKVSYDKKDRTIHSIASIPITNEGISAGSIVQITNPSAKDTSTGASIPSSDIGTNFIVIGMSAGGNIHIQSASGDTSYTINYADAKIYDPNNGSWSNIDPNNTGSEPSTTQTMINNATSKIRESRANTGDAEPSLLNIIENSSLGSLRGIFGMPYQFLPQVDPRIKKSGSPSADYSVADSSGFGRMYTDKILSRMPILVMQAGVPDFLQGWSKNKKGEVAAVLKEGGEFAPTKDEATIGSKYYAFTSKYQDYFNMVDMQCRAMAALLQIGDIKIAYDGNTPTAISDIRWMTNSQAKTLSYAAGSVCFYVNAEPQSTDSFNNGTTPSQLSGMMNNIGKAGSELQFLMGGASSQLAKAGGPELQNQTEKMTQSANTGSIIDNLIGNIQTLLNGGRMAFPEIWSDSTLMRSYTVNIKLDSPDSDVLSIYLNILVPLAHILGFVAPRSLGYNNYISPFLVRAYYKSMFHIDMGIITDCQITRGDAGSWTQDGLPTQVNVTLTIKDLYDTMAVACNGDAKSFLANPMQLDYLANLCGINIGNSTVTRTIQLYYAMFHPYNLYSNMLNNIYGNITGVYKTWFNLWHTKSGYTM